MTRYDVKSILESNTLPIGGGAAKRLKEAQAIESSRKRDEMIALGSAFQYGNPGPTPLQAYPLMQQYEQPQTTVVPLLTLQQNPEISHFSQDAQFHQSYIQSQLQLNQQQQQSVGNHQFYNSYLQNNPGFLHGFMGMGGSSSSVMDNGNNNGSSSGGSYSGGYLGNSMSGNGGGSSAEELGMVKVDYDMPAGSYGGWSGDSSAQGSNPGLFSMWND